VDPHHDGRRDQIGAGTGGHTLLGITIDTMRPSAGAVAFQGGHTGDELPGRSTCGFSAGCTGADGRRRDAAVSFDMGSAWSWSAPAPEARNGRRELSVKGDFCRASRFLLCRTVCGDSRQPGELANWRVSRLTGEVGAGALDAVDSIYSEQCLTWRASSIPVPKARDGGTGRTVLEYWTVNGGSVCGR